MKKIRNITILLLISALAGYLLLVLVYAIPQNRIIIGCANSVSVFEREDLDEKIFGYPNSNIDVYTDGAMFNTALFDNGESPFKRAVACYQYRYDDKSPEQGFREFFYENKTYSEMSYTRYWHGFLIFLRPLLMFFNYSDIRVINQLMQTLLLCLVVGLFVRRRMYVQTIPVILTYFYLQPLTLGMCLQYSTIYYIAFGGLALLTAAYDKIREKDLFVEFFCLAGILTSYFDLLTYPMFVAGFLLAGFLLLILDEKRRAYDTLRSGDVEAVFYTGSSDDESFYGTKNLFIKIVLFSIAWGVGYIGMWVLKWIISVPFFGLKSIADAINQVKFRSGVIGTETFSYGEILKYNFFMYKNSIYRIVPILYLLLVIILVMYNVVRYNRRFTLKLENCFLYLVIMAIPFVWFFVAKEHSSVHAFMTHKNFAISFMGMFCICSEIITDNKASKDSSLSGSGSLENSDGSSDSDPGEWI